MNIKNLIPSVKALQVCLLDIPILLLIIEIATSTVRFSPTFWIYFAVACILGGWKYNIAGSDDTHSVFVVAARSQEMLDIWGIFSTREAAEDFQRRVIEAAEANLIEKPFGRIEITDVARINDTYRLHSELESARRAGPHKNTEDS